MKPEDYLKLKKQIKEGRITSCKECPYEAYGYCNHDFFTYKIPSFDIIPKFCPIKERDAEAYPVKQGLKPD